MTGALVRRRIVVTRALHQAAELEDLLRRHGAEPVSYPCIALAAPADPSALDAALEEIPDGAYQWLVLTSANTALVLRERLAHLGAALPAGLRVATVGPATAEAARSLLGVSVSLVAPEHVAESLAAALEPHAGMRILLPQAEGARPVLAAMLRDGGASVETVVAYSTVRGSGGGDVPALLAERRIDAVTLTSGSTASGFMRRLAEEGGRAADLEGVCIACIGRVTADVARRLGLPIQVVPAESTLEALVDGLVEFYSSSGGPNEATR